MQRILDFLKAAKVFYFATVDNGRPRVRPFGFFMEHHGRLYFGMGTHKNVWKQVMANPFVEVCACGPDRDAGWARIDGKAVVDTTPEAAAAAFEAFPSLKNIYTKESGLAMGLIYLEGARAEFVGPTGAVETVTF